MKKDSHQNFSGRKACKNYSKHAVYIGYNLNFSSTWHNIGVPILAQIDTVKSHRAASGHLGRPNPITLNHIELRRKHVRNKRNLVVS